MGALFQNPVFKRPSQSRNKDKKLKEKSWRDDNLPTPRNTLKIITHPGLQEQSWSRLGTYPLANYCTESSRPKIEPEKKKK